MGKLKNEDLDKIRDSGKKVAQLIYEKVVDKPQQAFMLVSGKQAKLKFTEQAEINKVPAKFKKAKDKDIENIKNLSKDDDTKMS